MSSYSADIPLIDVPFVDKNGCVDRAWLMLLIQLWRRTGSSQGVGPDNPPLNTLYQGDVYPNVGDVNTSFAPQEITLTQPDNGVATFQDVLGVSGDSSQSLSEMTFLPVSLSPASLIGVRRLTGSGIYYKTPGTRLFIVDLQGGGGAGGGAAASVVLSTGGGGGAGAFVRNLYSTGDGIAYAIGSGGIAVLGASGGDGGDSTFGTLIATGGKGGITNSSASLVGLAGPGGAGGVASGGNLLNIGGNPGIYTYWNISSVPGPGGAAVLGGGGTPAAVVPGGNGTGNGGGGAGTISASSPAVAGGNGAPGVALVFEFA